MKKATIAVLSLMVMFSLCFGQKITSAQPAATMMMAQGTIDSIKPANPVMKSSAELSFKKNNGNTIKFTLSSTSIYDSNSQKTTLGSLKAGDKAKIRYSVSNGVNEAMSITLIK